MDLAQPRPERRRVNADPDTAATTAESASDSHLHRQMRADDPPTTQQGHDVLQRRLANAAAVKHNNETAAAMAAQPRRPASRPEPRDFPLPRPGERREASGAVDGQVRGDEEEEEDLTSLLVRGEPSRLTTQPYEEEEGEDEEEEPRLPPTPTRRGIPDPIVTTPPSGIHRGGGQHPRRHKRGGGGGGAGGGRGLEGGAGAIVNGAKDQPPAVSGAISRKRPPPGPSPLKSFSYWSGVDAEAASGQMLYGAEGWEEERRRRRVAGPSKARGIKNTPMPNGEDADADGLADKRAGRDRLRAQLDALEADVALVERAEKQDIDPDELLDLLGRHLLPREEENPTEAARLLEAALDPILCLPFGNMSASVLADDDDRQPAEPVSSHRPIDMSAAEELPFLQLLTPLALTHTSRLLARRRPDDPLLQLRTIGVSAGPPLPPHAFAARVLVTVDTSTLAVVRLAFPRLDPTAALELRPFLDGLCRPGRTRSLARNVTVATWGMGEWLRVAVERAAFWRALEGGLGRWQQQQTEQRSCRLTSDELLPLLGQTAAEIASPPGQADTFVRMQWRIRFDWSGDARSEVSVLVGLPGKWIHADDQRSLGGVARVWRDMVRGGKSAESAVRTIVALLGGDER